MKSSARKVELASAADLFSTEQERQDAKLEKVQNIPLSDLVFFKYTYDAPNPDGVTHCGIYVGNGMMIHCGSPISYANLNTSYWQAHFYCYGRLPES